MPVTSSSCNRQSSYTGRVTAQGPHERLVDFLNTLDVEDGTDELSSVAAWQRWTGRRQSGAQLREARRLRDHLRALAAGETPDGDLQVPLEVQLDDRGARLRAESPLARIAAAAARLAIEDRLVRIKICPADDCRWAFYDTSKNQSRQWCSMRVCGNRAKARRHRMGS